MAVKTFAGWKGEIFDEYVQVGDVVDQEMIDYFMNSLPPVVYGPRLCQAGSVEDYVNGRATYLTFEHTAEGWVYRGYCYRGETTAR
ncbi:hypothetical protein [Paenibacillus macerans]|nr:hypothetical protein [Paenibacillus macerans]